MTTETNGTQETTTYEYDGNGNRTKQTRPKHKNLPLTSWKRRWTVERTIAWLQNFRRELQIGSA